MKPVENKAILTDDALIARMAHQAALGRKDRSASPQDRATSARYRQEDMYQDRREKNGRPRMVRALPDVLRPERQLRRNASLPTYGYWNPPPRPSLKDFTPPKVLREKIQNNTSWTRKNIASAARAWHKHGNASLTEEGRGGWPVASENVHSRMSQVTDLVNAIVSDPRLVVDYCYQTHGLGELCMDLLLPGGQGVRYGSSGLIGFLNQG